jgi:nucleoside-diphosphate-sugar epimerase
MRIAITGALGHIGSALFLKLIKKKKVKKVLLIDNFLTQRYPSLFNLPKNRKLEFLEADISKKDLKEKLKNYDFLIHLAAMTDAESSVKNQKMIKKNNLEGTRRIATTCAHLGIKLVFISSTSVYGTQSNIIDEECNNNVLKPQSPYAAIKIAEENILKKSSKAENLRFTILRFGTIFGISKGMRFHTAINKFCWQASFNTPITIWRTAYNQKRPYLDLEDGINSIIFVINKDLFNSDIFNILTINTSVKEIILLIKNYVNHIKIEYVDSKIMNQLSYEVSNKKIVKKGFTFDGNLKKGVKNIISHLKISS